MSSLDTPVLKQCSLLGLIMIPNFHFHNTVPYFDTVTIVSHISGYYHCLKILQILKHLDNFSKYPIYKLISVLSSLNIGLNTILTQVIFNASKPSFMFYNDVHMVKIYMKENYL